MTEAHLRNAYSRRKSQLLDLLAPRLTQHIAGLLGERDRIDRVSARAKGVDSFIKKALHRGKQYNDPLDDIQDQVAARIVVFYTSDVDPVSTLVQEFLRPIEETRRVPESESAFGYEGKHFIFLMPTEIYCSDEEEEDSPEVFELQIKTLFQHAWSEANHDLAYKPGVKLTDDQNRRVAFTAAQAWGADMIFRQLYEDLDPSSGDATKSQAAAN